MGKLRFEAWTDKTGTTLATREGVEWLKTNQLLALDAKLRHIIEADTHEEAMAVHHIKMGFEPYKPGKPEPCPNNCGSYYYPEGSGECPKCGKIC